MNFLFPLILILFLNGFSIGNVNWNKNMYRNTDMGYGVVPSFITRHQIGPIISVNNFGQCLRKCTINKDCLAGDFQIKNGPLLSSECILLRRMPTANDVDKVNYVNKKMTFWKRKSILKF
jgi:hypothetical protein